MPRDLVQKQRRLAAAIEEVQGQRATSAMRLSI